MQERFPPRAGAFTVRTSELELPEDVFALAPVAIRPGPELEVIFVWPRAR
ncbi:MAG: hypothetical protein R3B06_08685 [Kofleriaceae bacterium]